MGRAFEYRKARKMKRWGHMARTFTKLGKEIEIAVKAGGSDPSGNTRLRILIQNAKAENMPKENIERAIKRATEKDAADYKEVIYEGYGPHGIAFLVETATDNTNRTVANVRMYFNKCGGTLGNSGSVGFLFDHKCVFKFRAAEGVDPEELELEMIDLGVDEFYSEEDGITVYAPYESFGAIQKWLDDKGFEIVSGESVRIPSDVKELDAEGRESVEKLVEKLEEDEPFSLRQAGGAVPVGVFRRIEVAAVRADCEPARVRGVASLLPAAFQQGDVPHVSRRGPGQYARRIAVAALHRPADVGSGASGVGLSFVGDAPFEVAVGRAAENDDLPRGRVMTSEMEDRRRAVVLLQPLGEGHGPEQPFGRVALFVGRDACEMVVLHRFDVFAAAAGVQVGERFGPRRTLRRPGFARRSVVHPGKNACRCRE